MESNSEKNPLDELFARKLGKLERSPSPDSFARLQLRMQGGQEQPRVVFWRNSTVQMAAAACLAVALVFGWLYTDKQGNNTLSSTGTSVAVNGEKQPAITGHATKEKPSVNQTTGSETAVQQLADNTPVLDQSSVGPKSATVINAESDRAFVKQQPQVAKVLVTKSGERLRKAGETPTTKSVTTPELIAATPAATSTTPKPTTERVLVVTIEEPEALVAARQMATSVVNNMPVLAASPTKEGKASFWQQVKRLKQDDDVARQEGTTDESGLLSRAYKGIRQKLEKDKPAKQ